MECSGIRCDVDHQTSERAASSRFARRVSSNASRHDAAFVRWRSSLREADTSVPGAIAWLQSDACNQVTQLVLSHAQRGGPVGASLRGRPSLAIEVCLPRGAPTEGRPYRCSAGFLDNETQGLGDCRSLSRKSLQKEDRIMTASRPTQVREHNKLYLNG